MKKFMVLYQSPISARDKMAQASPEQIKGSMNEWIQWKAKTGDDKVEWGMPLQTGKHIESGEATASNLSVSGYAIVHAGSLDEAVDMLKDHPHLKAPTGSSIEVLEFLPMPGM